MRRIKALLKIRKKEPESLHWLIGLFYEYRKQSWTIEVINKFVKLEFTDDCNSFVEAVATYNVLSWEEIVSEPEETKPEEAKSDETKPEEAKLDKAKPDEAKTNE